MDPSSERFRRDDQSAFQVNRWLVSEIEFVRVDRGAKLRGEGPPFWRVIIVVGSMDRVGQRLVFADVHGDVGTLEQRRHAVAMFRIERGANTQVNSDRDLF